MGHSKVKIVLVTRGLMEIGIFRRDYKTTTGWDIAR